MTPTDVEVRAGDAAVDSGALDTGAIDTAAFDAGQGWTLDPDVALRHESFGALAYHYGNRRLVFLKSRRLVALVSALAEHGTAGGALDAVVPAGERRRYEVALDRLARSGVIRAR